jgi:hypothetical protein
MSIEETQENKLRGIWRSMYRYPSSGRGAEFTSEHLVQMFRKGNNLILESVPGEGESYLLLRLSLEDNIATGTWEDSTDPNGYYKGATYHGAVQLVINDEQNHMAGKWVGVGKNMEINTGPWEFTYISDTLGQSTKEL